MILTVTCDRTPRDQELTPEVDNASDRIKHGYVRVWPTPAGLFVYKPYAFSSINFYLSLHTLHFR
jgi:hypothetical protein